VDLEGGRIELTKPWRFEEGQAALQRRSEKYVDELAATLKANPDMKLVVVAHTAETDDAQASMKLTRARARALVEELGKRGVSAERLHPYGCGQNRPVAPNNVPWGRRRNERIELLLLDPAPEPGVHSLDNCQPSGD
jgi:outer membrane protein OmpA-like peptidoglycan-associated protein